MVTNQPLGSDQPTNAVPDSLVTHCQKLTGSGDQLFFRKKAVSGGQIIAQLKQYTGFHPTAVVTGDPQGNGKLIHCPKGRVQSFLCQKIRVVIQHVHGCLAIKLIGADSQLSRQMM